MCLSANLTDFFEAGDSAILVEFGAMKLDVFMRARIHAFQVNVQQRVYLALACSVPVYDLFL